MANVTFRNAISNQRMTVEVRQGQTVHDAVLATGLVEPGSDFSVRDKQGNLVDSGAVSDYKDQVLTVGLPGEHVTGGYTRISVNS